jgi:hypothetical protein
MQQRKLLIEAIQQAAQAAAEGSQGQVRSTPPLVGVAENHQAL